MNNDRQIVTGWTSAYLSPYKTVEFTSERRKALVDRIRKREYDFTFDFHQFGSYGAPFYSDNVLCVLTRQEWDSVMEEAHKDRPRTARITPEDVINRMPVNDVLYEKEKWEPKNKENEI